MYVSDTGQTASCHFNNDRLRCRHDVRQPHYYCRRPLQRRNDDTAYHPSSAVVRKESAFRREFCRVILTASVVNDSSVDEFPQTSPSIIRQLISRRLVTGRTVVNAYRSAFRASHWRMGRPASQQWPAVDTIVTVPATEFSDDTASSSGGTSSDDAHVSGDVRSPPRNGIDDRPPSSSSLPVAECAVIVPSVAKRTLLPRFADGLRFTTGRATFDAQPHDVKLS